MSTKPSSASKGEQAQSRVLKVIATLMMLVIPVFQVNRILTASGGYVDSHNAPVAENLTSDCGCATSYETVNPVRRFIPEATTGPVMPLPAALFMKLFGK